MTEQKTILEEEEEEDEFMQNPLIKAMATALDTQRICVINCLGRQGTGKTNTLMKLGELAKENDYKTYYVVAPRPEVASRLLKSGIISGKKVYLALDDMSFIYQTGGSVTQELRGFMNCLARIRHLLGTERIIVAIAYHDVTSIAPFMRLGDIDILHIPPQREIEFKRLQQIFPLSALMNYRAFYLAWLYEREKNEEAKEYKPLLMRSLFGWDYLIMNKVDGFEWDRVIDVEEIENELEEREKSKK